MPKSTVIPLSKLYGAFRWDAECYEPEVLRDQNALAGFQTVKLASIATITDGQHGYHEVDDSSSIRHITARCIGHGIVSDAKADRLSFRTHDANKRSQLEVDDILLSTAGTIGNAGIVANNILPANIDQDVARVTLHSNASVDPAFLVAFLASELGQFQCRRATTGQIQGHISLGALREFDIPILANQAKIADLVRSSVEQRHEATRQLKEAETTLAVDLGLEGLSSASALFYFGTFNSVSSAGRFDAEYFSPRYQQILNHLSASKMSLKDVADLIEARFIPTASNEAQTFRYVEIGDISGDGLADDLPVDLRDAPSRAQWIAQSGDVITSTVRPIRRLSAIIRERQAGCVCSSGFAVLRPRVDAGISSEVLLAFLRLPTICELLDLNTTASMYPAISTQRLLEIPFRVPSVLVREKVADLVRASFAAGDKAEELLSDARGMVEATILKQ